MLKTAMKKYYNLPDFVFTLKTEEEIEQFCKEIEKEEFDLPPFEEVWEKIKDKVLPPKS